MTLTGVDPFDPTPSTKRELIFGAGTGSSGVTRDVVIFGNSTAAGSEVDNELNGPIADDQDARDRFGERSELYLLYKTFVEVDKSATIYGISVPDIEGTAAAVPITVVGVSDADSTVTITILGKDIIYLVANGDAIAVTAAGISAAIDAYDEGRLPVTTTPVAGVCTVTAANTGERSEHIIGETATRGLRVKIETNGTANTQTVVKTVGSFVPGVGNDVGTTAIGLAAARENLYWHVAPWHTVTSGGAGTEGNNGDVAVGDFQTGDLIDMINTQALPVNSKEKQVVFGLVGTSADSILVPLDAQANAVRASFFWQENNDWTPGMLAAYHCAIMRSGYIAHPSRSRAGYTSTDSTPYNIPAPAVATDVPTATEIRTALNNGVSPISFSGDTPYLVRAITARNFNAGGQKDYKAREHHIVYAIDFVWQEIKARWYATKQEFVADDPADGAKPIPNTSTPSDLKALIFGVIDTMTGPRPLGIYTGPILAPDLIQFMKDSVKVAKIPAGLSVVAEFIAVQHLLKFEGKFLEVGEAY